MKTKYYFKIFFIIFSLYYSMFCPISYIVLAQELTDSEEVVSTPTSSPLVNESSDPTATPEATLNPESSTDKEPESLTQVTEIPSPTPESSPSPSPDSIEAISTPTATIEPKATPILCSNLDLSECISESTQSADLTLENPINTPITDPSLANLSTSSTDNNNSDNDTESPSLNESDASIGTMEIVKYESDTVVLVNADSNSGNNLIVTENESILETGNAYAIANFFSLINSLLSGSFLGFEQILLTNINNQVDLNQLWHYALLENSTNTDQSYFISGNILVLDFQAIVDQLVTANANSGSNTVVAENSEIKTGDAGAAANGITVTNSIINDSTLFFTTVNVVADNGGLIILPRTADFENAFIISSSACQNCISDSFQSLLIKSLLNANANTGDNDQIGMFNFLSSGDATAIANSLLFANLRILGESVYITLINTNPNWQGTYYNWPVDDSSNPESKFLVTSSDNRSLNNEISVNENNTQIDTEIEFNTQINSDVSASANSGLNSQISDGENMIQTGNAVAFANFLGLFNGIFQKTKLFFSIINVLSPWQGNIALAYPDLSLQAEVSSHDLKPGDNFSYRISCQNKGTDVSHNTKVLITIPGSIRLNPQANFNYLGNDQYEWLINDLNYGSQAFLEITGSVDPQFSFAQADKANRGFTKPVYASDNTYQSSIITHFEAVSSDPELNKTNNSSTLEITVSKDKEIGSADSRLPKLTVNNQHNVNEFVYPGDTVTFTAFIKNESDVESRDSYAIHTVYNENNEELFSVRFDLGSIPPAYEGRLTFGLTLPTDNFKSTTKLKTKLLSYGRSPNDTWVASNEAWTEFVVKSKTILTNKNWKITDQKLLDISNEQVLAASSDEMLKNENKLKSYIYLLLLTPFVLIIKKLRKDLSKKP